ncbi:MAG: heavy metal-associated domain-containing protein [Acidobacteriota bacterium]
MKRHLKCYCAVTAAILLIAQTAQAADRISKISVRGMYCLGCARGVEASLSAQEGIKSVKVKLAFREDRPSLVTVKYDDEKITEERLRELLREQGFEPLSNKKRR